MLPAGLGLDPQTLKKMKWNVLNLSIVPVAGEVIGVTIASHYFLDLPWLWGLLLGYANLIFFNILVYRLGSEEGNYKTTVLIPTYR